MYIFYQDTFVINEFFNLFNFQEALLCYNYSLFLNGKLLNDNAILCMRREYEEISLLKCLRYRIKT